MTARTPIALSAGGLDKELAEVGIGMVHVNELMVRLARQLLTDGHPLSYGGTLTVVGNDLTQALINAAGSWLEGTPDAQPDPTDPSTWPLHNHAAWPYYRSLTSAQRARLVGTCSFTEVDPPGVSRDALPADVDLGNLTPAQAALTAHALSAMREQQAQACGLRIVWAGRIEGAAGWLPGILEEVMASVQADKPVLVLGGFGGCAGLIARFLETGQMPKQLTYEHAMKQPSYAAMTTTGYAEGRAKQQFERAHQQLRALRERLKDKQKKPIFGLPHAWFTFALTTNSPLEAVRLAAKAAALLYPDQLVRGRAAASPLTPP